MLPFNRADFLRVDEKDDREDEGQPLNNTMNGLKEKPILNGIIEMGQDDNWCLELKKKYNRDSVAECSWRGIHCISRSLTPLIFALQYLSYFPGPLDGMRRNRKRTKKFFAYSLRYIFTFVVIAFNLYLAILNFYVILLYEDKFGLMHASTVSCIITAVKPIINVFLMLIFAIKIKDHIRLLKVLDTVDVCYRSAFHLSPPIKKYLIFYFIVLFFFFAITEAMKVWEWVATGMTFGNNYLQDSSFVIVPFLTIWNIVPLLYYELFNRIVRFYCRALMRSMDMERRKRHFSLKFYYEQFLRITTVQEAIGDLFNPFVLFSFAWSMMILCLTIYFLANIGQGTSLWNPITVEQVYSEKARKRLTTNVHFIMGWASVQVIVAIMHIAIICSTGLKTNESTRKIVNSVLRIVPDANADLDRFQIACFVHKMSTQFMWGMTVWRAFPLERTTFFTLVSVIITYSFLLFKLKDNEMVRPIVTHVITNVGNYTFDSKEA